MQFTNIKIEGLFGLYNYNINLNNQEEEDKLTIITGPNGYGKTTILTILSSLNSEDLYYFYKLRYSSIVINFDDDSVLSVKQKETNINDTSDTIQPTVKEVSFVWKKKGEEICRFKYTPTLISYAKEEIRKRKLEQEDHFLNYHLFLKERIKEEQKEGKEFNNIIAKAQNQSFFIMKLDELLCTNFIHANRVYCEDKETDSELPINKINNDLKEELEKENNEFLKNSQLVDANFIKSVLSLEKGAVTNEQYIELANEVQKTQDSLVKFQLTSKVDIPTYQEDNSKTLYAYLEGLKTKYAYYQTLLRKLVTFDELLNSKQFINKTISLSPQHGIKVTSANGDLLKLNMLSSGEQNEIVILYKLVFEVKENSILLIDEPENSLHVVWQKMFLKDITKIAETNNLQLIIATHSITIASEGSENLVDLYYVSNQ